MTMRIAEETWAAAVAALRDTGDVALVCHTEPDGDALGSMLALQRFLRAQGKRTAASFGRPSAHGHQGLVVPPQYTFLPGVGELVPPSAFPAAPSVLVTFDTASPERLGTLRAAADAAGTVIVLDHHPSGARFGDVQLIDGEAAATAVLVDELIRRLGGTLDRDLATCLYVGIVTDTARFQHPSTTPGVLHLAARLLAHGIDHSAITRRVWETRSFGYLKVLGRALERAALVPEAGLCWTAVRQHDLDQHGVTMAETEGLIDVLRELESAEIAMVCKEQPDGTWAVSLRSRSGVDVGRIAEAFGGGGHTFAAGFTDERPVERLVEDVIEALTRADTYFVGPLPAGSAGV